MVTRPGEWRVQETLDALRGSGALPLRWEEDDRFFASREDFARWAKGRKQLRMEYFYRELRRKTGLLMEGDQPAGAMELRRRQSARLAEEGGGSPRGPGALRRGPGRHDGRGALPDRRGVPRRLRRAPAL